MKGNIFRNLSVNSNGNTNSSNNLIENKSFKFNMMN